ncbi:MAG: regulatory protein RecX [Bacteroidetes bacterium]|nr:regulatory protein RecX [Bacteroidota bacterium]
MSFSSRKPKTRPTLEEARHKAERYCAYQERSHQEVQRKLYSLGLNQGELDEILVHLIRHGFLNEERFARAFSGGKFRTMGWGKVKIQKELKARGLNDRLIQESVGSIDSEQYERKAEELLYKKRKSLRDADPAVRKAKLQKYLTGKGYELDLVYKLVKQLSESEK